MTADRDLAWVMPARNVAAGALSMVGLDPATEGDPLGGDRQPHHRALHRVLRARRRQGNPPRNRIDPGR
ncbi:hypothetical protein FMEAI12_2160008 [Parafrankia sp. Ea1.12]|nr:hypothetical protein FMEAI12_2160008 [Parafrankia sp. Ea1.12]